MSEPGETAAWLVAAETALGRRDPSWPGGIEALLHPAFLEIGASGRTWTRATIGELLARPSASDSTRFVDFDVIPIGEDAALVTYRTVEPDREARRVSVWTRTEGTWRLRYHQGTVVPAGPGAAG
jgi:hypothetical protein